MMMISMPSLFLLGFVCCLICTSMVSAGSSEEVVENALRLSISNLRAEFNKVQMISKARQPPSANEVKPFSMAERIVPSSKVDRYSEAKLKAPMFLNLFQFNKPDCSDDNGPVRVLTYGTNLCLPITASKHGANSTMYIWDVTTNSSVLRQLYFRDSSCTSLQQHDIIFIDFKSLPEDTCTMDGFKYSVSVAFKGYEGQGTTVK
jgi:hypothetical protein